MLRATIGVLGFLTAVFPERILEIFESIAIENPEEATPRPWVKTGIRTEGIAITAASLVGGRVFASMMNLTGVFGAVVFVVPEAYRTFATHLLYSDPHDIEWKETVTSGLRLIGGVYVLLAIIARRNRRSVE